MCSEALSRAMACYVVINRLPLDVLTNDSSGKSPKPSSTYRFRPHPRDSQPSRDARKANATDSQNISEVKNASESGETFNEPWTKLKVQAQNLFKQRLPKPVQNVDQACEGNAIDETENSNNACTSGSHSSTCLEVGKKVDLLPNSAGSLSTNRASRERKPSCSVKRGRERALSTEWDWSGRESSSTGKVPQNKRIRTRKTSKRTSSLDGHCSTAGCDCDDCAKKIKIRKAHKCHICDKSFNRPQKLRSHLYAHLDPNQRPFSCEKCPKAYSIKSHLERHKSTSHSDLVVLESILCPSENCGKVLATACGLKRHMNKMHSEEALKFACSQCDQKFRKNKQLRYHLAEHHGQPPLRCKECNAGVFSDSEMRRHLRSHKKHPCDVPGCDHVFDKFTLLRKHKAEHNHCFSSLRCAHCDKEFSSKSSLRSHVMIHLEDKQVFKCPYDSCSRVYYQRRNLNSHIRVNHERTSQFTCNWENCNKIFYSKRALTKHLNVHKFGKVPVVKKDKQRARRKDAGKPKRSMATMLTGVEVCRNLEQELLEKDGTEKMVESEPEENIASIPRDDYLASRALLDLRKSEIRLDQSNNSEVKVSHDTAEHIDLNSCGFEEKQKTNKASIINYVVVDGVLVEDKSLTENLEDNVASLETAYFLDGSMSAEVEKSSPATEEDPVNEHSKKTVNHHAAQTSLGPPFGEKSNEGHIIPNQGSISNDHASQSESFHQQGNANLRISFGDQLNTHSVIELCGNHHGNVDVPQDQNYCDNPTQEKICNQESCILSATLCAETIVECQSSSTEREVLLVIPKTGQIKSVNEVLSIVNSDAVVKALSGDVEVFSVAEKPVVTDLPGDVSLIQEDGVTNHDHLKKMGINDPSVSSILKPLFQCLANGTDISKQNNEDMKEGGAAMPHVLDGHVRTKPVYLNNRDDHMQTLRGVCQTRSSSEKSSSHMNCYFPGKNRNTLNSAFFNPAYFSSQRLKNKTNMMAKPSQDPNDHNSRELSNKKPERVMNPAYIQSMVLKFAKLIKNDFAMPLDSLEPKPVTMKGNLQGPSQDLPESENSSGSESNDSHSDDSGSGDENDNGDYDEVGNSASEGDGNDDDEEEEEEEEEEDDDDDDVVEEEEDEEEEEENNSNDENSEEESGNNGGTGPPNGGNDNNNNNNGDNNGCSPDVSESDREIDQESRNGHGNLGAQSNLTVDRSSSPKHAIFDDSDAGCSAQSDDLVIVEESETEERSTNTHQGKVLMKKQPRVASPKKNSKHSPTKCSPLANLPTKSPKTSLSKGISSKGHCPAYSPSKCSSSKMGLQHSIALGRNHVKDDPTISNSSKDSSAPALNHAKPSPAQAGASNGRVPKKQTGKFLSLEGNTSPPCSRRRSSRLRNMEATKAAELAKTQISFAKMKARKSTKRCQNLDTDTRKKNSNDFGSNDDGRDSNRRDKQDSSEAIASLIKNLSTVIDSEATTIGKRNLDTQNSRTEKEQEYAEEMDSSDFEAVQVKRQGLKKARKFVDSDSSDLECPPKKKMATKHSGGFVKGKHDSHQTKPEHMESQNLKILDESQNVKKIEKDGVEDLNNSKTGRMKTNQNCILSGSDTDESESIKSDSDEDPTWKSVDSKEGAVNTDDSDTESLKNSLKSSQSKKKKSQHSPKDTFHISGDENLIGLKTSPASASEDPLYVRYDTVWESRKQFKNQPIACKQLSESAWISVFREMGKVLKLSTSVEDEDEPC